MAAAAHYALPTNQQGGNIMNIPELNEGEVYVGLIVSADGTKNHHIILLPSDIEANWQKATKWAASIGGELPDRVESALLFATLKSEFKNDWYWTREQHASYSDCAWMQYFGYGSQYDYHKGYGYRARAVRRLAIQSFSSLAGV